MRKKIHNTTLVQQILNDAVIASGDVLVSKAISHCHHQANYMEWARTDISMRCLEVMSRLGLVIDRLLAAAAKRIVEDDPNVSQLIAQCQTAFEETIHALIAGRVIMAQLEERGYDTVSSEIGMVHLAISHGIRKAQEHCWNHHRDHSVKPMLSRFRNAIKMVVDGNYLDAIRDVTAAVYMTELDLDPTSLQETNNRSNLTGTIAAYSGE
jgi:hypothetical protein